MAEEFVTLNGLKKYDVKKGTAEVDVSSLPLTPEHRVYVKHDNDKTLETVWAKDVEVATEYDVQNNIEYVNTIPSSNITSKVYGIAGTEGSFSCTEAAMESQTDAMKVFFDFTSGTTKVPLYFNNKQIQTFAKPTGDDTVYEFYDDLGQVIVDLTTAITINYVEPNKYYAGDLTNQTTTELATADYVKSGYIPLSQKAKPKGVATLDANGRLPEEQMPLAALVYKGQWDASSGVFPVGTFVPGDFFIVSVAGTISDVDYAVGDWIIYNGTSWDLSENQNDVHSVNDKVGVVVLKDEDIDTAALPTGASVDYYIPETDTIQDALIKHDNELTNQDTRLDRIEAETNAEHTKQVTFFANEAAIPTTTTDTFFFGVGEYAYAIAEQTWYKLTAIDSSTKALTWTEVDVGLATPYTAGEGIDITNNEITNTSRVWEGTQAEYNLLTPAEKVGIALFLITDSVGTGVTVDDTVEDGNLNAVTSNAVYDAIKEASGVKWVNALPVSPNIESVVYVITSTSEIYIGNATNQTTIPISAETVVWVSTLPVTGIKNVLYARTTDNKFYIGDEANQLLLPLSSSTQFIGTEADWELLTPAEQSEYELVYLTDVLGEGGAIVVDEVANGNMNAVSSNAVYDALTPIQLSTLLTVSSISSNTHTVAGSGVVSGFAVKLGNKYFVQGKITLTNTVGCTVVANSQCKVSLTTTGLAFDVEPIIRIRGQGMVGITELYANDLNDFWFRNFDGVDYTWSGTNVIVVQLCGWAHTTN